MNGFNLFHSSMGIAFTIQTLIIKSSAKTVLRLYKLAQQFQTVSHNASKILPSLAT